MSQTLALLKFEKYYRLACNVFAKKLDGFVICDANGLALWTSGSIEENLIEKTIKLTEDENSSSTNDNHVFTLELPENQKIYCIKIYSSTSENSGFLIVNINHTDLFDEQTSFTSVSSFLVNIVDCIKHDHTSTLELDAMAIELAERYDELNLLYTTDDKIHNSNELHHLLNELLKNCTDYLDVEVASLIVPDKIINIKYTTSNNSGAELSTKLDKIKEVLYERLMLDKTSVVINNDADSKDLYPEFSCKVLSSPIIDSDGSVVGALVIAKNKIGVDFTNSNKNLLEVMSMKVSKLIQENFDVLTGLLNRSGYEDKVSEYLKSAREQDLSHSVFNIDIDDFQVINDTYGYSAGDDFIRQVATIIKKQARDSDIVARTGGNEFSMLLGNCSLQEASLIAENIRLSIGEHLFEWENHPLKLTTSIGVVSITSESKNIASIMSTAELANTAAKEHGKNTVQTYNIKNRDIIKLKYEIKWVSRIQSALSENRFQLYCQVIEPLKDCVEDFHIEILLRLKDEDNNILVPSAFLPAAERYLLMPEIDRWVVSETLKTLSEYWPNLHGAHGKIAINLSGQTLGAKNFLDFIINHTDHAAVDVDNICFEVTESAAIANLENAKYFMSELRKLGFQFSLDDFGTGLSSFEYLKTLSVDYLKIDGSFVKEIIHDPISATIVTAINQVGHFMGLKTIAEFAENDAIKEKLKVIGIDFAQGYSIYKPRPLTEYLDELSIHRKKYAS